ncbi:MAG: hypothetical protein ACK41W_13705 [Cyanobacteriota bacterium]
MPHSLVFVLSRETSLPEGSCDWAALVEAQRQGIRSGTQLRLFRLPETSPLDLPALVEMGAVTAAGEQPTLGEPSTQVICDALVPLIEPRSLWLGVYQVSGPLPQSPPDQPGLRLVVESVTCLDRYPLLEAANETCWFYPTDNGRYLAWENRRTLQTQPGHLPDRPPQPEPLPYERGDVHVLWALMADDLALTCVGLTCRRQRIEWPAVSEVRETLSTWTEFEVDSMAESSYRELNSTTVFLADPEEA